MRSDARTTKEEKHAMRQTLFEWTEMVSSRISYFVYQCLP